MWAGSVSGGPAANGRLLSLGPDFLVNQFSCDSGCVPEELVNGARDPLNGVVVLGLGLLDGSGLEDA